MGAGGLDFGSVHSGTTYNIFAIASAGGSGGGAAATNCIASKKLTPDFSNTGSAYALSTTAEWQNASTTLYSVQSVAGIRPNDVISGTNITTGTTVTAVGTATFYLAVTPYTTATAHCTTTHGYNCFNISTTNLRQNLAVSDNKSNNTANGSSSCSGVPITGQGLITSGFTNIVVVNPDSLTGVIELNNALSISSTGSDCFTISGGNTITLSAATTGNAHSPVAVTIYTGLYRMLGAVYTPSSSTNVVQFVQNGDTFLLNTPVNDIAAASVNSAAVYSLPSVPTGIVVEALGRCVAGNGDVLLYTPPPAGSSGPGTPGPFSTAPGYSVNSTLTNTAFPIRLFTDGSTNIEAAANSSSTLSCMTDGWVWKRAQ